MMACFTLRSTLYPPLRVYLLIQRFIIGFATPVRHGEKKSTGKRGLSLEGRSSPYFTSRCHQCTVAPTPTSTQLSRYHTFDRILLIARSLLVYYNRGRSSAGEALNGISPRNRLIECWWLENYLYRVLLKCKYHS